VRHLRPHIRPHSRQSLSSIVGKAMQASEEWRNRH
jgi:hypothetical protein